MVSKLSDYVWVPCAEGGFFAGRHKSTDGNKQRWYYELPDSSDSKEQQASCETSGSVEDPMGDAKNERPRVRCGGSSSETSLDPVRVFFSQTATAIEDLAAKSSRASSAGDILQVIRKRFEKDAFQTKCGRLLVVVNPLKKMDVYGRAEVERYSITLFTP